MQKYFVHDSVTKALNIKIYDKLNRMKSMKVLQECLKTFHKVLQKYEILCCITNISNMKALQNLNNFY